MTKLFLDDEREPPDGEWTVVRSFDAAITYVLSQGCPEFISFDNDLGPRSKEGWEFAQWLIEHDLTDMIAMPANFDFTVHSQNPVAAQSIESRLRRYLAHRRG